MATETQNKMIHGQTQQHRERLGGACVRETSPVQFKIFLKIPSKPASWLSSPKLCFLQLWRSAAELQVSSQPALGSQTVHAGRGFLTLYPTRVAECPHFERRTETEPMEGLRGTAPATPTQGQELTEWKGRWSSPHCFVICCPANCARHPARSRRPR